MKIMVTGAGGLVGSQVVSKLKTNYPNLYIMAPSHRQLDILNIEACKKFISDNKPQILIHTAWVTTHGKFWNAPENEDWRKASLELAENFYVSGGDRFFSLGTCAEYKWDEKTFCEEGITELKPFTLYGAKKNQLHRELQVLSNDLGKQLLWGRVFFPFGIAEKESRVVPLMINASLLKNTLKLSSGLQRRDFLFHEDLGDLIAALSISSVIGELNLSSGHAYSLREIAAMIGQIVGNGTEYFKFSNAPLNEPELIVGSVIHREKLLQWKPSFTVQQGLEKCVKWWSTQHHK